MKYLNKIKSLALVGVAALAFTGCRDFLYIEPKTFVSEDNFWNEKTDVDQMVAGVYVKMQADAFLERCIMWGETRSDNVTEGRDATKRLDLYRCLKEDLKSTNAYTDWTAFYAVIGQCNIISERCEQVAEKDPTYTHSDVMATKAEMAAIRDLCYFYLVRAFKDVPYYTFAIQSDADIQPMPAVDGDQIVKSLIEDLDTMVVHALTAFPKDNSSEHNSSRNRFTRAGIYALLADLCLWDGQYQKCVDYCQKVIDYKRKEYREDYAMMSGSRSGYLALFHNEKDEWNGVEGFPLYQCYEDKYFGNTHNNVFSTEGNSFESIFELCFTPDGSDKYAESNPLGSLYGSLKPNNKGGNDGRGFLAVNDKVLTDVYNSNFKVFDHKLDVRYFENIRPDDDTYTAGYVSKFLYGTTDIEPITANPFYAASYSYRSDLHEHNWIFYRLTDVMLMQAEALIQLGQVTETTNENGNTVTELDDNLKRAFYLIWTVNRRSIMTTSTNTTHAQELKIEKYQTKSALLDLCLQERQRELMFEGKRWFDLLRQCHREGNTNYVKANVSAKIASGATNSLFVNYESLYWPYNKTELRNNPDLKQKAYYGASDDDDKFQQNK